jgi:hypothetical protein
MTEPSTADWIEANQRYLTASLAVVKNMLERHSLPQEQGDEEKDRTLQENLLDATNSLPGPSALEALCKSFGLSCFERDTLLICAGMELDSTFAALCSAAQGNPQRPHPTFGLALAAIPGAHWSALTPASPLRRWRLIEVGSEDGLTASRLRIDERVLHYLTGVQYIDERLAGIIKPIGDGPDLVPSHRAIAEQLAGAWSKVAGRSALPVIQLCGENPWTIRALAMHACSLLGLNLSYMVSKAIPTAANEVDALCRLWEREAAMSTSALLLECDDLDPSDAACKRSVQQMIEDANYPLIISSSTRQRSRGRIVISFDVKRPASCEQRTIWNQSLGSAGLSPDGQVEALVSQFNFSSQAIQNICAETLGSLRSVPDSADSDQYIMTLLWEACCSESRSRLEDLAQRIEPAAGWSDLILPEPQTQVLRNIAVHVRNRSKVYETWGFARKSSQGAGISALFAGSSGTGKTMAAEVLAGDLNLDLYRIDLSAVVSKYIGETEKNLRRVFDAAEEGGSILLFDEADALFGRRSEVKDSHDRYANIEVSYLLQRMEAYRGLAILTTNMKNALDPAFLRRIRFVVSFPFPDVDQRVEIWKRIFPRDTPTEGLDFCKLAMLNIAGGNIRNIALGAAFLAANAGEPVRMGHVLRAAQAEYAKLEKPLTGAEVGGWV